MNIVEILPKDNFMLYIKTEDGTSGMLDVKPYLDSEVFAPLKNQREFERVHNGRYFIEWDCGADLSADTILARWNVISGHNAQQGAPADAEKRRG